MNLDDKLVEACGGYNSSHYSVGRYMLLISMPEKFGLSFSNEELKEIGRRIRQRAKEDFEQCLLPAVNMLFGMQYQTRLEHLEDICAENPKTEYELLEILAKRSISKLGLSDESKHNIDEIRHKVNNGFSHSPLDMTFMDKECLQKSNKSNKTLPIDYIMLRNKSDSSLVLKFIKRMINLYDVSDEDLRKISKNGNSITKKGVRKYGFEHLAKGIRSGNNMYDFLYEAGIHLDMGGPLNNLMGDLILVDSAGAKICASEKEIRKLKSKLDSNRGFIINTLPSRFDNFLDSDEKDRSIVYGLKGVRQSNYAEIRLQTVEDNYEGEFGKRAHFKYKPEELREIKASLGKYPELDRIFDILCYTLSLDRDEVLSFK